MRAIMSKLGLAEISPGAGTGLHWLACEGELLESISPIDGSLLGKVRQATGSDYEKVSRSASQAFHSWRVIPAPKRGEVVRQIGNILRDYKKDLAALVTLETGKILPEAEGEVQEMIDMCDFAVGQSRMLYGLTMHSERPSHRMYEQWHPLGPVGVITAFNFPVAVWSWNAMIALIAGDTVIWKPSSKVPLSAVATMNIVAHVLRENDLPEGILNLVIGRGTEVGEHLIRDDRLPLISATGSVPMGCRVGQVVVGRLGKPLLELGGNNAVIVSNSADLKLAIQAILFGAIGTAGQRCTTVRRVIAHKDIHDALATELVNIYKQIPIGNPLNPGVLMGPLIDKDAVDGMQDALRSLRKEGARILHGGEVLSGGIYDAGTYVTPCICEARNEYPTVQQETFAPILYLIRYENLAEAVQYQNAVPQGLTSSIFTENLKEAEQFLSAAGSDCGIANVNISTSGAEIGGAFGGEKASGWGREAGSDAWKFYMRRQTSTINWSSEMPLAQGIRFGAG